jgi:hypothetical protein
MYALLSLILTCSLSTTDPPQSEILPNGTYRFEIAFAEWDGKTMGDEVIVILNDGNITLKISENSNSLWMGAKPGDVIEEGTLRKHQSGQWIISNDEKDIYLEEIGGCTGGPTIIHFENQTIEMC